MMISTTVWLILQPQRRGYDGQVVGLSVDRILVTQPRKLGVRDVAVKVNIECDERMFTVPRPEVTLILDDQRALIIPKVEPVIEEPPLPTEVPEEAGDGDGETS